MVTQGPHHCLGQVTGSNVIRDGLRHDVNLHDQQTSGPEQLPAKSQTKCQRVDIPPTERTGPVVWSSGQRGGIDVTQAWRDLFARPRARAKRRSSRQSKSRAMLSGLEQIEGHQTNAQALEEGGQLPSRLGKSQLGKYAHEEQMPSWLVRLLEKEGEVRTDGVVPVLEQLLEKSQSTQYAYLCHPHVQHVSKLRREGGFCGYRNIQVLISHITGSHALGWEQFGDTLPNIFQIQDLIENAWDRGYNAQGRTETGGIKGTRKYIGTPEAQVLFCSLGFPCSVQAFRDAAGQGKALDLLLQAVERYFQQGSGGDMIAKVRSTVLPPIYLQRPGHSVTIVGIERQKDGRVQLLVFDPTCRDSNMVTRVVGKFPHHEESTVDKLLRSYRRSESQLCQFSEFEVLL